MRTPLIILKYELKSLRNYLLMKKSRLIGFLIGNLLELLYIYVLFIIFSPEKISPFLIGMKQDIINALPGALLVIAFFSFSAGSSLIATVRKGIKNKLGIFITSPQNPNYVLFIYLLIQSLAVTSLITEIIMPMVVWVLLAIGIDSVATTLFALNLILVILAFSFLGALSALAFARLGRRKRMILSLIVMTFATIIYLFIYGYEVFGSEMNAVLSILNTDYSPLKWFVFPIYINAYSVEHVLLYAISDLALLIALMYISFIMISRKFFEGKLTPPSEVFKYDWGKGIIYKLFKPPMRGLIRKELKDISREPLLLNTSLLGPVLIIVFTLVSLLSTRSNSTPLGYLTLLTILIYYPVFFNMLSTNYYAVSLALERRSLAVIFSSPTDPEYLIKAKAIIISIIEMITGSIQIILMIALSSVAIDVVLIFLIILIINGLSSIGIGADVGTKYVNFKADNPRRALERTGGIILFFIAMIFTIIHMFIIMVYVLLSRLLGWIMIMGFMIFALIILRGGLNAAYGVMRRIEIGMY